MVNPDRPWPRPETPRPPLDATSSETLELWAQQPEWDTRSIEEFAADGGRPVGPPNRIVREPGFLHWLFHPEGGWLEFFRWLFRWRSPRHGYLPADPPGTPELRALPRAPIGGTGETRRDTGYLRASLDWAALGIPGPGGHGGDGRVIVGTFRGQPIELPPIYPEEDDEPIDAGGCLIFPFPKDVRPTLSMKPPPPDSGGTVKL